MRGARGDPRRAGQGLGSVRRAHGFAGWYRAPRSAGARDVGGSSRRRHGPRQRAQPEFREADGRARALANLAARGIDGWSSSAATALRPASATLAREGFAWSACLTIDNDLYGTDVASAPTRRSHHAWGDRQSAHHRLVAPARLRGGDDGPRCGYIALMAGIAGGARSSRSPSRKSRPRK